MIFYLPMLTIFGVLTTTIRGDSPGKVDYYAKSFSGVTPAPKFSSDFTCPRGHYLRMLPSEAKVLAGKGVFEDTSLCPRCPPGLFNPTFYTTEGLSKACRRCPERQIPSVDQSSCAAAPHTCQEGYVRNLTHSSKECRPW